MRRTHPNLSALLLSLSAIIGLGGATGGHVWAVTIDWTVWSSFSPGNPGTGAGAIALPTPVNVGYSGELLSASYTGFGPPPPNLYPTWQGPAYVGGTIGNGPSNQGGIALSGGATAGINTVTFSVPVTNPVMAIWSLGSAGTSSAEFDFTAAEPFTIQAGGADNVTFGQTITLGSPTTIVSGIEGNGVIQFAGTYSSITWTNPIRENDYAFTIGAPTPEPASIGLFLLGATGALMRRRLR
jgi:hypothetical protein